MTIPTIILTRSLPLVTTMIMMISSQEWICLTTRTLPDPPDANVNEAHHNNNEDTDADGDGDADGDNDEDADTAPYTGGNADGMPADDPVEADNPVDNEFEDGADASEDDVIAVRRTQLKKLTDNTGALPPILKS
jgi:hypothetical protein